MTDPRPHVADRQDPSDEPQPGVRMTDPGARGGPANPAERRCSRGPGG